VGLLPRMDFRGDLEVLKRVLASRRDHQRTNEGASPPQASGLSAGCR
jgi:hypothetical protein